LFWSLSPSRFRCSAQSTLSVGQRVKTTANVNVRSKPTNAKKNVLCIQTTGSVGAIVGGPIVATGYIWLNVNFDSKCDGWAAKSSRSRWHDASACCPSFTASSSSPSATSPSTHSRSRSGPDIQSRYSAAVHSIRAPYRHSAIGSRGHRQRERSAIGGGRKQKHGIPDSNTIHVNFGAGATWIDNATFAAIRSLHS
jgi:hypothetical protein